MPTKDTANIWVIYKSNLDNLASDFNKLKNACDEIDSSLLTVSSINEEEMKNIWKKLETVHNSYDKLQKNLEEFLHNCQDIYFVTKFQEIIEEFEQRINNISTDNSK